MDTNALLFWLQGSKRLKPSLRAELADSANDVYVSAVSAFEIAVKASLDRLILPASPASLFPPFFERAGLRLLPISVAHGFGVFALPHHHADPFDRLLIAQALAEDLTIVTSDRVFASYPVEVVQVT